MSVQTYPKLYVNQQTIPTVQRNKSFKYLGRFYSFKMDNQDHKLWLISETERLLNKINRLPLHPRYKLELYAKYLLPKISWHLTIADINITWVKQSLDMLCHNKFREWLEIPASGTLDILFQTKSKFGLNIIDVSTKFTQCQVTLRKKLKNSKSSEIRQVFSDTSKHTNIQYDRHISAKHALKDIRQNKIGNIVNNLTSQSLVIKAMWEESFAENVAHWHSTMNSLPKNIYNFITRYLNNTLPTLKNLTLWKLSSSGLCKACLNPQNLQHVITSCKIHLEQGRLTWRHNSVLKTLAEYLSINDQSRTVYADVVGFENPSVVSGLHDRPDMMILNNISNTISVIELTIGFETNLSKNCLRKTTRYKDLCRSLERRFRKVNYFNLSMGASGLISKECKNFYKFLEDDMKLEARQRTFLVKKLIGCCIRTTYYLFCMKDKTWTNPDLLFWD